MEDVRRAHGMRLGCTVSLICIVGELSRPPAALCSINSMDIEPHALVGERVRVWWEQDQRFYAGKVAAFNPETWQHEVRQAA